MDKADKMAVIMRQMLKTYRDKNADYGDSFSKSYKEFGLTAPVIRMSDKMERIKSLTKADAKVKDESIKDTLIDLANYAIMTVIELEENEGEDKSYRQREVVGEPNIPGKVTEGMERVVTGYDDEGIVYAIIPKRNNGKQNLQEKKLKVLKKNTIQS